MSNPEKRLVFCISPHGFGHAAQTSSVVNHLIATRPELEIWIKTSLSEAFIKERFHPTVKIFPNIIDFGMLMASSIDVLAEDSWLRYKALHDHWDANIEKEMAELQQINPDLVVSNIAYVSLEAAHRLNIPSIAMSSLNWADIFEAYCNDFSGAESIIEQMRQSYDKASTFVQFTPCPPMNWLNNKSPVSPITRLGNRKRQEINTQLQLNEKTKLVLIGLGGIEMRLSIETWPIAPNTLYIVPDEWQTQQENCIPLSVLQLPFIDILASVDGVITKPGYGTFSEAVCNQTPFVYVLRGDWPEEPFLEKFAKDFGNALSVTRDELNRGLFLDQFDAMMQNPDETKAPPKALGHEETVEIILNNL